MKNYPTNKIIYNHLEEIQSFDLADMVDFKISNNRRFRYIFIIFDNFTKYLWCITPENINSQTLISEFSNILTTSKRKPIKLQSDRGAEWYTSVFQIFLKIKSIRHHSRFTDKGQSIAERVIRTIRNLLKKPVFLAGNADWLSE